MWTAGLEGPGKSKNYLAMVRLIYKNLGAQSEQASRSSH